MENRFKEIFGEEPLFTVEAPGRIELGGNHTDHQRGLVLASPARLKINAWVRLTDSDDINIFSEGRKMFTMNVSDLDIHEDEKGTTMSLIRGMAAQFADHELTGFNAYINSDVPSGSGLSSSAAMEILLGKIFSIITKTPKSWIELAQMGMKVENEYFGKPCGLLDQMACAASGIIAIDFADPEHPKVEELDYDFKKAGYRICVIKCGAGHEEMTDSYASVPQEMEKVCEVFGKKYLREIPEDEFYRDILKVREACGDRAVLRAMHIYNDNHRVENMIKAIKGNDIDTYLAQVRESGRSSWELLQNVVPSGATVHQDMAFTIKMAERILRGRGAVRIHGGGFAGTAQAYVPIDMEDYFKQEIENLMGEGSCYFMN